MFNRLYKKIFVHTFEQKRKYLIKQGAKIGKNTRIISNVDSFGTEPYLIELGDNCLISSNVTFMTHDGGISVLNNLKYFDEKMDKLGRIKVGDNVFIGKDATIMPGVVIGNNTIIGLGSIVTKNVPDNVVVAGVPAKIVKKLDEYAQSIENKVYPTANMTMSEKKRYCKENNVN